jgi:chromosome partitioning protein
MRKIAVAMAKGGVGKTTTAVNLAHGLSTLGHRVLLVDCDTQGQAAMFLGAKPTHGLYEFITGRDKNGNPVIRQDALFPARKNLWLLAGGISLVELKHWLGEQPRETRQTALAKSLVPKAGTLDFLVFDCAPGWDVLSVNILMAATEVICPVALQGPSMEGLKTFFTYLLSAQKLNPDLQLKYVLPTMFDRRTRQSFDIMKQLLKIFRRQLCDPIAYNVRLSEAPARGKTIFEYDARAVGAKGYKRLIRKIVDDGREKENDDRVH